MVGSIYAVSRANGDMMRTQLYNGWMDIEVGLGHRARTAAKGILASPSGKALELRDGTKLTEPLSANDLYQRYAKSWVVAANESLFVDPAPVFTPPAHLVSARTLDPAAEAKARADCTKAGVTDPAHLDSCTLDAVVLNNPAAIIAFTRAIPPKITIKPIELR
jgi:hypothetical protein